MLIRKLTSSEAVFSITVSPEDEPVRGSFGLDDEQNKAVEDEILERLSRGDEWVWCSVKVTAAWCGFNGVAHLGCCNYDSEADFLTSGYFQDMCMEALDDLNDELRDTASILSILEIH